MFHAMANHAFVSGILSHVFFPHIQLNSWCFYLASMGTKTCGLHVEQCADGVTCDVLVNVDPLLFFFKESLLNNVMFSGLWLS